MLINCSECGREISDKAVSCPHCGNPISSQPKKSNSLSHMPCPNCGTNWHTFDDNNNDVCKICNHIFTEKEISDFKIQQNAKQRTIQASKPKCPICGSTNISKISTLSRASSIVGFGILSKKIGKQWQCNNPKCKHMW